MIIVLIKRTIIIETMIFLLIKLKTSVYFYGVISKETKLKNIFIVNNNNNNIPKIIINNNKIIIIFFKNKGRIMNFNENI